MSEEKTLFESDDVETTLIVPPRIFDKKSEDVVENEIVAEESFAKFAGSYFSTETADFTDRVVKKVYEPKDFPTFKQQADYAYETPFERYKRLQSELASFKQELAEVAKAGGRGWLEDVSRAASLEADALGGELERVAKQAAYAPFLDANFPTTPAAVATKNATADFKQHLTALRDKKQPAQPVKTNDQGAGVYELYLGAVGGAKVDAVALDKRLATIEQALGDSDRMVLPEINEGIVHLHNRIHQLDQTKTEAVGRKMRGLLDELDVLDQQKLALIGKKGSEASLRVREVYELTGRFESSGAQLGGVVARLQSLEDLRKEAASAPARLTSLDKDAAALPALIKDVQQALEKVSKSFAEQLVEAEKQSGVLERVFAETAARFAKLK